MSAVRPGTKQTEVGVIPEEWEVEQLGALIGALDAGVSVRSVPGDTEHAPHDEKVLKTSCISSGRFLPLQAKPVLPDDLARIKTPVRADTILISRMNTPDLVGEVGYVEADHSHLFLPDRLWMARPAFGRKISMRWLTAVLAHGDAGQALRDTATGTSGSMKNISKPALRGVPVPTPPPHEQQAIAEALGDADALIEGLEALIAKKRDIKQGAMQDLLTGQRRLPGFQGGWKPTRLQSCITVQVGFPFASAAFCKESNGLRLVRNRDLKSDDDIIYFGGIYSNEYVVGQGDLLVSMDGEFTLAEWTGGLALLNQRVARLKTKTESKKFLLYALASELRKIEAATGSTTVKHLSHRDILAIELSMPTLDEQHAIAAVLSDMDAEIAALEDKLAKARALKQGMMQVLLTGEIRLV